MIGSHSVVETQARQTENYVLSVQANRGQTKNLKNIFEKPWSDRKKEHPHHGERHQKGSLKAIKTLFQEKIVE